MLPLDARAQNKPRPTNVGPAAVPLPPDTIRRLKSGDPALVQAALDDARMSGRDGAPAAGAIADLLRQGQPPLLTQAALETLGETIGNSQADGAIDVLSWYSHQRNVALRRVAVTSLGKVHGPVAAKALRAALSDPDDVVRGLAATELGGLTANPQGKETVSALFVALDHKVEEAAASIGQLCDAADCERLAGKLGSGRVPFDVMAGALDQVLLRPPKEVDEPTKVAIVGRVRELGTAEANQFLRDLQTKWPAKGSPRVKQSIDQAVIATSGSPGHRTSEPPQ
jgi:HEAT repeat protein